MRCNNNSNEVIFQQVWLDRDPLSNVNYTLHVIVIITININILLE